MRHTEFWERMTEALGSSSYAWVWSEQQVMATLGGRTVQEALTAGESPKLVWRAVWETLELPTSLR